MDTYKHINDCWNALENCGTIDEVKDFIDEFPNKFGTWDVRIEDGYVVVTNGYYDNQFDSYEEDERELDIQVSEDEEDEFTEEELDKMYHDYSEDELREMGAFGDTED